MSEATINIHSGRPGDVVVVSGHRTGEGVRLGEILEILGEVVHPHYRVRWDDDTESIFYPGSDASIRRSDPDEASRTSKPSGTNGVDVLEVRS